MDLTNLIAFWELEEASGARNDSHSTNHLTDNNTVTSGTGKVGTAAHFAAASSESLTRADNAALSTGDIDFTMHCWVNLDSNGLAMNLIEKNDIVSEFEYVLRHFPGFGIQFRVASGSALANLTSTDTLSNPFATGGWHFVVAWHDAIANTINTQCDNGTIDSKAYTFGSYDSTASFTIGGTSGASFDGLIDQVGFWKRVLTTQEKTDLYNGGAGLSYAAMIGGGGGSGILRQMMNYE